MKAVILAAGRGSRLAPITNHRHKTLLEINSQKILERQIQNYARQGVQDIYVVTGYRSDEVAECISQLNSELTACSVHVIESEQWDETDNLYSLSLTSDYVRGEPFVLSNGDVYADSGVFDELCAAPDKAIVPYDSSDFNPEELKIRLDDGRPISILDKGKRNGNGATIGMFAFNQEASEALFADIDAHIDISGEKTQWFEASLDRILSKTRFDAVDVKHYNWVEIDTREDLVSAWGTWSDQTKCEEYIQSVMTKSEVKQ